MTFKTLVLEGGRDGKWVVASVTHQQKDSATRVVQWNVSPFNSPPQAQNAFTLTGKSLLHYFWLAMAIAMPLICITALVSIWRGPKFRRRWLWTIGCLLGFVGFSLNWSTGDTAIQPISIRLLGAAVTKVGVYAPWIVTFSLPIFAVIFPARRHKIRGEGDKETTSI